MAKKSEEKKEVISIKIKIGDQEFSKEEAKEIFTALKKIFEPTVIVEKEYTPYWPWVYPYPHLDDGWKLNCRSDYLDDEVVGVDIVYSDGSSASYTLD